MEINPTSPTAKVITILALGVVGAGSMGFNAYFGASNGTTELTKGIYASVSVGLDVAKIMGLAWLIHHIGKKAWVNAISAGAIWIIAAAWAMVSAIGCVTIEQAHVAAQHAEKVTARKSWEADVARLQADIEKAKGAINDKGGNIFQNTGSCLNATKPDSKAFCNAYLIKLGELNDLKKAPPKEEHQDPQPFLTLLAEIFGTTKKAAGFAMAIAFAIGIEVVTSLATVAYAKTQAKPGTSARAQRRAEQRRIEEERRTARRQREAERSGKVVQMARR